MFEFGKWVLLNLEFTIILIIAILLWLFSSKPFYCESYDFFLVFQIHCITWSNFFHNQMLNISAKDIIRKEDITPANQLLRDEQIKKKIQMHLRAHMAVSGQHPRSQAHRAKSG